LRQFLSKQRRCRRTRHCSGELVKAKLKFIRQFHVVRARPILSGEGRLAQARLEFVRRKRWRRGDLGFQLVFEFVELGGVSLQITLQFPVVRIVWKRIETLQAVSLCCGLVEPLFCVAPNAPSPVKQCGA
jgi:hypothetical protein